MVEAIAATKLDTIVGPIAWDGATLPPFAAKNVAKTPLVGGQWRLKDGRQVRPRHHRQPDRAEVPTAGKMEADRAESQVESRRAARTLTASSALGTGRPSGAAAGEGLTKREEDEMD